MKSNPIEPIAAASRQRTPAKPGSILLAAQAGVESQQIARLLAQAGLQTEARDDSGLTPFRLHAALHLFDQPQEAIGHLQDQSGAHLLLLYREPVMQIADAVGSRTDPEIAVTQWQEQAEELLAIYRRARRRITLLEASAALAEPNAALEALNRRLDLSLTPLADEAQAQPEPERDPVHVLIAERALHQDTHARHAAAELQASALPLSDMHTEPHIDLSSTAHTYREKSEVPLEQVHGLKEENALLLSQLEQVQDKLKSQTDRREELKSKFQEAEKQNNKLADENQELKSRIAAEREKFAQHEDLQEENELLLAQLHQVQEELESYFLENQELRNKQQQMEKANTDLSHQTQEANDALAAIYKSWSWKLTAPLRLLLRPFMGK